MISMKTILMPEGGGGGVGVCGGRGGVPQSDLGP